jgi:anti-sigma factor RsiW
MKKFNEIEQLSAYLDRQLNESESKRLKNRIESDVELDSVLKDLSSARNILRKLPARKSPRNFTLTRKMVGMKPPLPRTYPLFRLATIFATLLFALSFSVNVLSPYLSFTAPTTFGFGGGGGGAEDGAPAAAQEAPATEETAMEAATEALPEISPQATAPDESATKQSEPDTFAQDSAEAGQNESEVQNEAPISFGWIIAFLLISILGALSMYFVRQSAKQKWQ